MAAAYKILQSETEAAKPTEPSEKVFRPLPKEPKVRVVKEDDEFVIYTPGLDRLYGGSGSTMNELRWQLNTQLEKMGVNKILEKAGVKKGDKIRCGDLTWEWLSTKHEGRKIGILGGTFDPVHSGHVMMAQEAVATLGLEELLIIPAGQPVYKTTAAITPAQQRLEMLQLAINGIPGLKISTIEIDRPGPSYTVDTIAAVRKLYKPGDEMYFVLGWDSLERVPDWKEPSKLINLCTLVAVPRPGYTKPGMRKLEGVLPGITKKVIFIDKPKVEISSTAIREMVEKGESIDHLVPKAVAEYIKKHHLYFGQ
jgi:nicotinate-nucleotide adenylyltransferase